VSRCLSNFYIRLLFGLCIGLFLLGLQPAQAAVQFGCVIPNQLAANQETAREFGLYLEHRLGEGFRFRFFQKEADLLPWLSRYREIDVAICTDAFLRQHPGGFLRVARLIPREGSSLATEKSYLIIRPELAPELRQRLESVLLQMADQPEGQQILSKTGVNGFAAPYDAPAATIAPTIAQQTAQHPALVPPKSGLRFGCVTPNSFLPAPPYARRLAFYLQNHLQQPVTMQVFDDEETLYAALQRYGTIDFGLLSEQLLKSRPLNRLPYLLRTTTATSASGDIFVARKNLSVALRQSVLDVLLGMPNDPEGKRFLEDLGVGPLQLVPAAAIPLEIPGNFSTSLPAPKPAMVAELTPSSAPVPVTTLQLHQEAALSPVAVIQPKPAEKPLKKPALPPIGVRKEQQGLWTEALLFYQDVLQQQPDRFDLWQRLADIQLMLQEPSDATLSLLWGNRHASASDAEGYFQLALAHAFNDQLQAAVAACRQASLLEPSNPTYLRLLALLAHQSNDSVTQRSSLQQLLRAAW